MDSHTPRPFVAYLRVADASAGPDMTEQQAVLARHHPAPWRRAGIYIEVEDKRGERPQLEAALAHCRRAGATLVVPHLGRLARSARFMASIVEAGVPFCACDVPSLSEAGTNRNALQMLASIADYEARVIRDRTRKALAAVRASGKALGCPQPGLGGAVRGLQWTAEREARDAEILPRIREIIAAGHTSIRQVAAELDRRGIKPPRAERWATSAVALLVKRAKEVDQ